MISRRSFLVNGLRVSAALPFVPLHRTFDPLAPGRSVPRTLVVLQLTGGNDGLNTLVPWRQDTYHRLRPTLAFEESELHAVDADHGLHPSLAPWAKLFAEGDACAIHSVGVERPDRSHFRSMEVWHTGRMETPARPPGWLGRMADQLAGSSALPALHIGGEALPLSLWSERSPAPSIESRKAYELAQGSAETRRMRRLSTAEVPGEGGPLAYVRQTARAGYRAAERVAELDAAPSSVRYPDTSLARKLRLVARLIEGRIGARVFGVELGGFDTHVRQERTHAALLDQVGGALGAFQADLRAAGLHHDVCTLVFSEFGRRVRENGSRGTDHGAAAPAFLFGGGLRPGLHGKAPDLDQLLDGDVITHCDQRALQAAIERDWMGLEAQSTLAPPRLFES